MKRFNEEIQSQVKLQALRRLDACSAEVITLVCFCTDRAYCHRRLIAEFLENQDRTEEFTAHLQTQRFCKSASVI